MKSRLALVLIVLEIFLSACGISGSGSNLEETDDVMPLVFTVEGDSIFVTGAVDSGSPHKMESILKENPSANHLILEYIEGSLDDTANLEMARMVRNAGLTTIVPIDGLVASGGTDLFAAGVNRIVYATSCVGVHSWASDTGVTAIELPRNSEEHQPYLNYYLEMGVDPDFYWFTLEAASPEGMYYMSAEEMHHYNLVTEVREDTSLDQSTQIECDDR